MLPVNSNFSYEKDIIGWVIQSSAIFLLLPLVILS
jgi:hypothetical protein